MKKFIIITTINPVTEAIKCFDEMKDWTLIVVGDKKTPENYYKLRNGFYMDWNTQVKLYPELSDLLGWDTVDRRNIGFLYAYQQGADVVAMVDDDNIPHANWGKDVVVGKEVEAVLYRTRPIVFDPLYVTKHKDLWHRGFPIELVNIRSAEDCGKMRVYPLVQANLWNGDPDVDAVCRIRYNPVVAFDVKNYYTSDRISPFNMQNTLVAREALKYLPSIPFTGRMCDIWASFYLQAYKPGCVVYGPATVDHIQKRSWESLVKDVEDEILGYKYSRDLLIGLYEDPENLFKYLDPRATKFVKLYQSYFD